MRFNKRELDVIETERLREIEIWEGIVSKSTNNPYLPVYVEALRQHRESTAEELIDDDHPRTDTYRHRLKAMMRTIKELAAEAISIQDASNPLGLTKGFAAATQELADCLRAARLPDDADAILRHPVYVLWVSKLYDLARVNDARYSNALKEAHQLTQE